MPPKTMMTYDVVRDCWVTVPWQPKVRAWNEGLKPAETTFVTNSDATTYAEMLAEARASPLYAGRKYAAVQKRVGVLWDAAQTYRAEQRRMRRREGAGPVAAAHRQLGADEVNAINVLRLLKN